ncbi:unnamed protein product [Adineta ricciae]|uniref:Uncharacterized protein n=1 Tax=Adineta ricciae TaxID=249248 RepID=A0A815KDP0_ADIRI|nr:unnamed protein product [Adineta ricciae]CAF1513013.1 unnamed protein product [Adineta ricciae]
MQRSQSEADEQCNPFDEHDLPVVETRKDENDSMDTFDSSSKAIIDTNSIDSEEVAPAADLRSQQVSTRQRRKRNRNLDTQNVISSTDAEESQQQSESQLHIPLNDLTNSSSKSRQIKRRRRY